MDVLCDELLFEILNLLPVAERAKVSTVCRSWCRAKPQLLSRGGAPCRAVLRRRCRVHVEVTCPGCCSRVDAAAPTGEWAALTCANPRCSVCCVSAVGNVELTLDGTAASAVFECADPNCRACFSAPWFATRTHILDSDVKAELLKAERTRRNLARRTHTARCHTHVNVRRLMAVSMPGRCV